MRVEALPEVVRRLRRHLPPGVREAFDASVERLFISPPDGPPDHKRSWKKAWDRTISNHRHVDLPDGWRMCYTIHGARGGEPVVLVLFVGTHKEYDRKYGFKGST